jgi:protein TonB
MEDTAAKRAPGPEQKAEAGAKPKGSSAAARAQTNAGPNYYGLIAAHLARYKQFPADARNNHSQGVATVSFSIDGAGHVTPIRLARATGVASLDHEAQAMPRRASPFPTPPGGQAMSFTVPVSFVIR